MCMVRSQKSIGGAVGARLGNAPYKIALTRKEKLEFLALVIGEKDVNYMNSKITDTDEPMELGQVVKDFLPPPDQLVPKGKTKTTQVTLELTEESVSFFKSQADRKQIT